MATDPESPIYSLYRTPRFSVNHLAEYLEARTAPQRTAVIRKAKFPKRNPVSAYQQISRDLSGFFPSGQSGKEYFAATIDRLKAKARRESGQKRDEALRCVDAIGEFLKTHKRCRLSAYAFDTRPSPLAIRIKGVLVNIRLDASITQNVDGQAYCGGCVLFMSGSDQSRRNIESRRKTVAAIIHWALGITSKNIEPLPRLCMSFDVFGNTVTRAPESHDRLRQNIRQSCQEAARAWDDVEPPNGYDGPDWR